MNVLIHEWRIININVSFVFQRPIYTIASGIYKYINVQTTLISKYKCFIKNRDIELHNFSLSKRITVNVFLTLLFKTQNNNISTEYLSNWKYDLI